jgi:hypothetical protein
VIFFAVVLAGALAVRWSGVLERHESPAARPEPVSEERLDELLPSLVGAVQDKEVGYLLDHVAPSFKEQGGLDFYAIRALLQQYALGKEPIGARLESYSVAPESDAHQRVTCQVSFVRGQKLTGDPKLALPEGAVTYALDLVFERDGLRWRAVSGSYKRESPRTEPGTPATSSL